MKRPGQDLNLGGVTQRFSSPPPYRARRPGQRPFKRTKFRISVPTLGEENTYGGTGLERKRCESPPKSCRPVEKSMSSSVRRPRVWISFGRCASLRMRTSSYGRTFRFLQTKSWPKAIGSASSRSSPEAPPRDRDPRPRATWGNRPTGPHFEFRPGSSLRGRRVADARSHSHMARESTHRHIRQPLASQHRECPPACRGVPCLDHQATVSERVVRR